MSASSAMPPSRPRSTAVDERNRDIHSLSRARAELSSLLAIGSGCTVCMTNAQQRHGSQRKNRPQSGQRIFRGADFRPCDAQAREQPAGCRNSGNHCHPQQPHQSASVYASGCGTELLVPALRLPSPQKEPDMNTMKAVVFKDKGRIDVEEVPKPIPRAGEAVIRVTTTTICGTDVHIVRGEYPVKAGLVLGHEPVGVIDSLGSGLEAHYTAGQRVIVGAITPCGQCFYCLNGAHSQCGGALGGWRFGNTINGAWAEYLLVPDARANLAPIPDDLSDEAVMLCPDIFSTGLGGAEA